MHELVPGNILRVSVPYQRRTNEELEGVLTNDLGN